MSGSVNARSESRFFNSAAYGCSGILLGAPAYSATNKMPDKRSSGNGVSRALRIAARGLLGGKVRLCAPGPGLHANVHDMEELFWRGAVLRLQGESLRKHRVIAREALRRDLGGEFAFRDRTLETLP